MDNTLNDKCMQSWSDILNLAKLERFKNFEKHVVDNIAHYRKYFDSSDAHKEPLAGEWNTKLDNLQKLLVLRCLRIDKSLLGIQVEKICIPCIISSVLCLSR